MKLSKAGRKGGLRQAKARLKHKEIEIEVDIDKEIEEEKDIDKKPKAVAHWNEDLPTGLNK